jgi:hypothetical protein
MKFFFLHVLHCRKQKIPLDGEVFWRVNGSQFETAARPYAFINIGMVPEFFLPTFGDVDSSLMEQQVNTSDLFGDN